MFRLSSARVCAHIGRETSAHKKTWSAHKCSFQNCVLHIFHTRHSKFIRVQVKCCTKDVLHADFKKLEGTLLLIHENIVQLKYCLLLYVCVHVWLSRSRCNILI